ncbi:coat protein [Trifolium medium]|uniref:Coat protein n=1 Tax=Trifolium medium TaxID=97028 RepID=A0A392N4N7_9FABA|nr:coat protein [Trifolium medium]
MNQTSTLKFSAATTIEDIPEDHLYAASTYNVNLLPANSDATNYHQGRFWDIFPNTHELTRAQIIPGVLATITREFHCD